MPQTYVALDLETTGFDPQRDEIIEIGCVKFADGEIVDEWSSLVNPGRSVPFRITQLTGIHSRDVAKAPPLTDLVRPLARFVGPSALVGHYAGFDLGFLRANGVTFPGPVLDTFDLATILLPGQTSYSLGALCEALAISLSHAHRAGDDARATALLFMALQEQATQVPLATLIEINRLAAQSNWSLREVFAGAERRATRTAFLKRYQRQALESGDLGPLLNQQALRETVIGQPLEPLDQPAPLDVEMLAAFLEPDGPLARAFAGYEHRQPQVDMLRAVADAFNDADHLLIEAGTGTGKGLAYLLPAIAWAVQNRRRVVISTNTINLQDQLYTKDIPDLLAIFADLRDGQVPPPAGDVEPSHFLQFAQQASALRVALMKGRANYLCPRRLDAMRSRTDLNEDELRVLARVLVWLAQTTTGDRAELFLPSGRDQAIWSRLATESGTCTAERCESSQGGRCFFYRNRRRAEAAHLIVVNHALLLSDVSVGNRALPEYRHLIIDEAHHLEDATTQQLSFRATQDGLERMLADLDPEGDGHSGLLPDLRRRAESGLSPRVRQTLERQIVATRRKLETARDELRAFFAVLSEFLDTGKTNTSQYNQRIRLDSRVRSQPGWSQVEIAWDNAGTPMYELSEEVYKLH
ncbi:MAG: exonuclease domain-containing protein, partial [Anaerolineae bacterium]